MLSPGSSRASTASRAACSKEPDEPGRAEDGRHPALGEVDRMPRLDDEPLLAGHAARGADSSCGSPHAGRERTVPHRSPPGDASGRTRSPHDSAGDGAATANASRAVAAATPALTADTIADQGVQHVVVDPRRAGLLDAAPRADLAAPRHGHREPDQVLLAFGQQARSRGSPASTPAPGCHRTPCSESFALRIRGQSRRSSSQAAVPRRRFDSPGAHREQPHRGTRQDHLALHKVAARTAAGALPTSAAIARAGRPASRDPQRCRPARR